MTKEDKIAPYNPSGIGVDNGKLFGLPFNFEESDIVVLPIPWEVTASFGSGTSKGPAAILKASTQLDLYHPDYPEAWKQGFFMVAESDAVKALNSKWKNKATEIILLQEKGKTIDALAPAIEDINKASTELNQLVLEQAKTLLNRGKKVVLLGGDHSAPLGYLQGLSLQYESFGVLQIDAHADLRNSYEGFENSHASIFYNALKINNISSLTQVGVRDICQEEIDVISANDRIHCFHDKQLKEARFEGVNWKEQVNTIVHTLPNLVYLSFDIDGLDPKLCPNTGTPVPGGLSFDEALYLISAVRKSGRTIIGADLCEVGNTPWDANVGARILYHICCNL